MTLGQQLRLTAYLSAPAVMAQLSSIAMQYIDASMVGSLGAKRIGLHRVGIDHDVAVLGTVCATAATGVLRTGGAPDRGRRLRRGQKGAPGIRCGYIYIRFFAGGRRRLHRRSASRLAGRRRGHTARFVRFSDIFAFFAGPATEFPCGRDVAVQRNMRVPSLLNVLMCLLDVVFNFFLIFPTRQMEILDFSFVVPGAGLGVEGAALGTVLAELATGRRDDVVSLPRSPLLLKLSGNGGFSCRKDYVAQSRASPCRWDSNTRPFAARENRRRRLSSPPLTASSR